MGVFSLVVMVRTRVPPTGLLISFSLLTTVLITSLAPIGGALDTDLGHVGPVCDADPSWDTLVHCREQWRMRYNHETDYLDDIEGDFTNALVVSPDGSRVFALGRDWGGEKYWDGPIIAIDPATGEKEWVHRQSTPDYDTYYAGITSSDSTTLYVTGIQGSALLTQAIDASTGDVVWTKSEPDQGSGYDIVLDESRDRLYVTAWLAGLGAGGSTQAHDLATGDTLWQTAIGGDDIQLTPDGSVLISTGQGINGIPLTSGLDPVTGDPFWEIDGSATEVVVAPDSMTVYLAGTVGASGDEDMQITALDTATGAAKWERILDGPAGSIDESIAIALSPDGTTLVVTGRSFTSHEQPGGLQIFDQDAWTLSLAPESGETRWEDRFDAGYNQGEVPWDLKFAPDGSRVYQALVTTGPTVGAMVTRALDPDTGVAVWEARTDGPWDSMVAFSGETLQVAPDGSAVYIGISSMSSDWFDLTVVAYQTGTLP